MSEILGSLKAVASLIGAALTAASAVAEMPLWITITSAILTAIATWSVPNIQTS